MRAPAERPGTAGRLVVVATPIGNLGDLAPRALEVLGQADVLCCEDTRRTRALLTASGIPAGRRLVSLHGHNERQRIPWVLEQVAGGQLVALVSDAGTPAVSDPGAAVVRAVAEAGLAVSVVPGPSSALAALVVSGLASERFCVEGFLPRRGSERSRRLEALAGEERTTVVFEAPSRLAATLAELAGVCGGARRVAVARELTKVHEEVWRGTLAEASAQYAEHETRGEVVLVLEGATGAAPSVDTARLRQLLAERLAAGDGVRDAAAHAGALLGVPRRAAYQVAIELRRERRGLGGGEPAG